MIVRNNDVILFDTDDDFYGFCIEPKLIAREYTNSRGEQDGYADIDFTQGYLDDVANGRVFIIRDPNSQIMKHGGVVSYKTISKKIDNLKPYYYEKVYNKKLDNAISSIDDDPIKIDTNI